MNIETVDIKSADAPETLIRSLKNTGFAIVTNHGIAPTVLDEFYDVWAEFFSRSTSDKMKLAAKPETQEGYFPFKSENAKGCSAKDLKEFYHMFYPFMYRNETGGERFTRISCYLGNQLNILGITLLRYVDQQLPEDVKAKLSGPLSEMAVGSMNTLLRVLHYPPLGTGDEAGAVRAAAHEDINLITLLPAATEPGLQVKDLEGRWHDVICDSGQIIVNIGDQLQEATDGYLHSTSHRVVNPIGDQNVSRYSVPLFVHARPNVRLSDRYTAQEYLDERLKEIGLK
jgi:isopenicillin N synthase-like dioxygenase